MENKWTGSVRLLKICDDSSNNVGKISSKRDYMNWNDIRKNWDAKDKILTHHLKFKFSTYEGLLTARLYGMNILKTINFILLLTELISDMQLSSSL